MVTYILKDTPIPNLTKLTIFQLCIIFHNDCGNYSIWTIYVNRNWVNIWTFGEYQFDIYLVKLNLPIWQLYMYMYLNFKCKNEICSIFFECYYRVSFIQVSGVLISELHYTFNTLVPADLLKIQSEGEFSSTLTSLACGNWPKKWHKSTISIQFSKFVNEKMKEFPSLQIYSSQGHIAPQLLTITPWIELFIKKFFNNTASLSSDQLVIEIEI